MKNVATGAAALAFAVAFGGGTPAIAEPAAPALAAARVSWNHALSDCAMVSVAANTAEMAAVDSDSERAARALSFAQRYAAAAKASVGHMPPEWHGAGSQLAQTLDAYASASAALRLYIAHRKPSALRSAQNELARGSAALNAAWGQARAAYSAMNGTPSDLESVSHAMLGATTALDSAMGETDTDDQ